VSLCHLLFWVIERNPQDVYPVRLGPVHECECAGFGNQKTGNPLKLFLGFMDVVQRASLEPAALMRQAEEPVLRERLIFERKWLSNDFGAAKLWMKKSGLSPAAGV
jgi:hypothetical protein